MENILYYILNGMVIIFLFIFLVVVSVGIVRKICENRKSIEYYKMEILRSDNEQDKEYWEMKLRRERIKCIPFVRWIVKR